MPNHHIEPHGGKLLNTGIDRGDFCWLFAMFFSLGWEMISRRTENCKMAGGNG
jgi:hypothetical protein